MLEDAQQKETVILVHGTWAAPIPEARQWYEGSRQQTGGSFVNKLNAALANYGSPARCWAHGGSDVRSFAWSGENDWVSRKTASQQLAKEIKRAISLGWRCHVIAHSHGGNILIGALSDIVGTRPVNSGAPLGRLITLGTPFIDIETKFAQGNARLAQFWFYVFVAAFLTVSSVLGYGILVGMVAVSDAIAIFTLLVFLAAMLTVVRWYEKRRRTTWVSWLARKDLMKRLLVLNSPEDEAWQILSQFIRMKNPLAEPKGWLAFVTEQRRAWLRRRFEMLRVQGYIVDSRLMNFIVFLYYPLFAASFLLLINDWEIPIWLAVATFTPVALWCLPQVGLAFWIGVMFPIVIVATHVAALRSIPNDTFTYIVRQRAWSTFQKMALGVVDLSYVPNIEKVPLQLPSDVYRYEDISAQALDVAMRLREATIAGRVSSLLALLSMPGMTASDVSALLKDVCMNTSLVHAAYYRDDVIIDRMARWIAGRGCGEGAV